MYTENYKPDFIFETSWEVCNKVGGIHTVISTKALTLLKDFKNNFILIGPDIVRFSNYNPEFIEDKNMFKIWREQAVKDGLQIRIGRWNIIGNPIVILVNFSSFIDKKDIIFAEFWEKYKLDSLSGQWDYIEPMAFGYASGKVIEHFYRYNLSPRDKVIAHFHEWMTGSGILYLKNNLPQIATVFTTHATIVGRSIAANGQPLHRELSNYNADIKAREFNIVPKFSCERIAAQISDAFTTVSDVTNKECKQFFIKEADFVTPNGFEDNFVPNEAEFETKRIEAKTKLKLIAETILGYEISEKNKFIGISGRYEFKNKGIELFLDAISEVNKSPKVENEIISFIIVPADNYGAREDIVEKLKNKDAVVDTSGFNKYLTHGLHDAEYDPILNKIKALSINNNKEDNAKVIFIPCFLNGNDGIFNVSYYDLLIGLDLTVFPSYYEPWGYTPLESIAFHIPTLTTNLTGFGQWIKNQTKDTENCLKIIELNDDNYPEAATNIANIITFCSKRGEEEINETREFAYKVSRSALWENLIIYYYKAYNFAIEKVINIIENVAFVEQPKVLLQDETSKTNTPVWRTILVQPNLSAKFKGLEELAYNLWWSWNSDAIELWEYIDGFPSWKESDYNPITLLKKVNFERFSELEQDAIFITKFEKVYKKFKLYMEEGLNPVTPKVAYFCMEYGISDTLKIFSGGLGILAGDYVKEASDANIEMVAVGLLYKFGYFYQHLTISGEQQSQSVPQDFGNLPLFPVKDKNNNHLTIKVALPGRFVHALIWLVNVGRIKLYLLDTENELNQESDRVITHHLYGGDTHNRLKQEMVLGVGGMRLLKSLGIEQDIFHMNEGHAALLGIERLHQLIKKNNYTFEEALEIVRASSLFTTHTPVPAGHDTFPESMVMSYMGHYPERLKISWKRFIGLGKIDSNNKDEDFSMSHLAANLSQEINGVSMLHGDVTKEMFNPLWKGYYPEELHIGYVTNGVHYPTWAINDWKNLYKKTFGPDFENDQANPTHWNKIHNVNNSEIWSIRQNQRKELYRYIAQRLDSILIKKKEDPKYLLKIKNTFNENALTIGFARRFATYKRGNLLFRDMERLASLVNNTERPVQFIFAGKAHPNDGAGQELIKTIVQLSKLPQFLGKIIFLENYDMGLAKKLVSGVDIWLNTPTRPLEASGTSGMKAVMNGCLHFSVLDGWWVEGYKEKAGWALDQKQTYDNDDFQNELDATNIYHLIEHEIAPVFYNRDTNGIPNEWVTFIKNSIANIAPMFTMTRMLDDYKERFYSKLTQRTFEIKQNNYKLAKEIASWKKKVARSWDSVSIEKINFFDVVKDPLYMGEKYYGEVVIDLNELWGIDLGVEMVITDIDKFGVEKIIDIKDLTLERTEGQKNYYAIELQPIKPGKFNYGFRVYPKNDKLPHRQDFAYLKWL
jgi:phosphorylase/glycogen(starch) synthase